MNNPTRILVCPLNWGLGHATRMVPVINQLIKHKSELVIASTGTALEFLKNEFPDLNFIDFPQYKVMYSAKNSQFLRMLGLIPYLIYYTIKEHFVLKKILKQEKIDCVISDNRYGLFNKSVFTVFITHQLNVIFPRILKIFEPIFRKILKRVIKKYNECWIPDFKDSPNLSGRLSHGYNHTNVFYIGPLSHFNSNNLNEKQSFLYKCLVILSGPEPQRTIFEQQVYKQLSINNYKAAIVRGIDSESFYEPKDTIDFYGMLNSSELQPLIEKSELVICRSGYSSIMDLVALQKTAVLVPTPGQTEQEYLANYLNQKGLFYTLSQKAFCIEKAIKNKLDYTEKFFGLTDQPIIDRLKHVLENLEAKKNN